MRLAESMSTLQIRASASPEACSLMGVATTALPGSSFGAFDFLIQKVAWFLMAESLPSMEKWMTAINAEVHDLFVKMYDVPEDNYWSQG